MFSILLTPFVMLLTVFGLYSPHAQHSSLSPSATVRPAITVAKKTPTTTPAEKPASASAAVPKKVVVEKSAEKKPEPKSAAESEPVKENIPAPKQEPVEPNDYASQTEAQILALMNAERAKAGLGMLQQDTRLAAIARVHSADMLNRDFFDHTNPDDCSSSCRANNADYDWSSIGENIYMTEGHDLSATEEAEMVVDGWMHSAGHKANILGTKYTNAGVGVFVQGDKVYVTAMYSKPR